MRSLLRIIILLILVGGIGYFLYQRPELYRTLVNDQAASKVINAAAGAVKGAATSLNIDASKIIDTATNKLVEKQLIDDRATPELDQPDAGIVIQNLTNQVVNEVKDLPKNQAKVVINKVCQQMIENIDKGE